MTYIWGLLLDGASLLSAWLLSKKRRVGWLITIFSMLFLWTTYSITYHQWGFFPGICLHTFIAARAWVLWGKPHSDGLERLSAEAREWALDG